MTEFKTKFKTGDKIRCINEKYYTELTLGKIYTATKVTSKKVWVINNFGHSQFEYDKDAFKKVLSLKEMLGEHTKKWK